MKMDRVGKAIKTFDHCEYWCLDQKKPVWIRRNRSNEMVRYGWKVVAKTPFGELEQLMYNTRIFEYIQ
jgi:hypothetical protein